jgi:hypothetical protein
MVEDVVVGFEDAVREPIIAMNCQMFSTGLSSSLSGQPMHQNQQEKVKL